MNPCLEALAGILLAMENARRAANRPAGVRLLAVSKTRSADEIRMLAEAGQRAFGENYVQEALPKIEALRASGLEWHLIGHLQSNKADAAARGFDWVQSVDRAKLVAALAKHRPPALPPLNVLLQVNIDDAELERRRAAFTAPAPRYTRGVLGKFYKLASSASQGAVLDA